MTDTRASISTHVSTHPGVHFNDLVRGLDLAPGQVQYHLRRLTASGDVDREHLYGRTHYFPPGYESWERSALAVCRRETKRDVLLSLLDRGPSRPSAVAADLGVARSTLEWHLDHLVECDLVEKRRDGSNQVTLVLSRPTETARLLSEIEPSLPDRMVDRFTRLLDDLFDEE